MNNYPAPAKSQHPQSILDMRDATDRALSQHGKIHPVPPGLSLTPDEQVMWEAIMRCKAHDEWKASYLFVAHRAIKLETILRRCEQTLAEICERSDPCAADSEANDYMKNLASLQKTQLTMFRSIGLATASVYQAKTDSKTNRAAQAFEEILEDTRLPSFLARPS